MAGQLQLVGDEIWVDGIKVATVVPGHFPEKEALLRMIRGYPWIHVPTRED